ncbi:hypothetical protein [Legionella sp. W10-070]|nr:hypothetical protein [Legionella sp. W10-070]
MFVEAYHSESVLDSTKRLLKTDSITLFEAEISYRRYLIRTDILIKDQNHLKLIEIKAKSINSEEIKKIEKKDIEEETKTTAFLKHERKNRSLALPSIIDLESRTKSFFQKADHVQQALIELTSLFYSDCRRPNI